MQDNIIRKMLFSVKSANIINNWNGAYCKLEGRTGTYLPCSEYLECLIYLKDLYLKEWERALQKRINNPSGEIGEKELIIKAMIGEINNFVESPQETIKERILYGKVLHTYNIIIMGNDNFELLKSGVQFYNNTENIDNEAKGRALYKWKKTLSNMLEIGIKNNPESSLTNREEIIRMHYLREGKVLEYSYSLERYANDRGKSFKQLKKFKNGIVDKGKTNSPAKRNELKNVKNNLSEYPLIQKAIENDISKLPDDE